MKKRIISLLLALIMALSLLPVSVLAVESSAEPTISADLPAEVALQPGDNFTLTVTALGSGTLSYQWYANTVSDYAGGTKIKGAESATYDVATAVEQVLYYYVEVTNTEEGKGPATVRSAISKVTVSKEGGGEVSDTPQITLDVVDAEDVVLPWHATTPRAFDSISYCLTNGVLFTMRGASVFSLLIAYQILCCHINMTNTVPQTQSQAKCKYSVKTKA